MDQLWANKYRPQTFVELVGGAKELGHLTNNMQHLLLHSRGAGRGKTTVAHVIANELDYTIHTFNASSKKTRGIAFVEEELIPLTGSGNHKQIILLDEADQLTPEAQSALKGVIENAHGYFILACNDISKVSDWIKSRCLQIHFLPIDKEAMKGRLEYICGAEGVTITYSQLNLICEAHEGDLRNAINALQAFASIEPDDADSAHDFLLSLTERNFNTKVFLTLCINDKDFDTSLKMLDGDIRKIVRKVMQTTIDEGTNRTDVKLQVVDASITAERDIIDGVDEDIVKANYVRMMIT